MRKTPPSGIAAQLAPEAIPEEVTGQYDGDQLLEMRRKRPTDERIERVELKQDEDRKAHGELVEVVTELRVAVATMSGKLDVLPQLVATLQADKQDALSARQHNRERITKVVAGVFGTGVLGAILHAMGVV